MYKLVGGSEYDRTRLGNTVTIDEDEFEVVDELVYLGSLATENNDTSQSIPVVSTNYGLHKKKKKLRSQNLSLQTKCILSKTLIRPVVL